MCLFKGILILPCYRAGFYSDTVECLPTGQEVPSSSPVRVGTLSVGLQFHCRIFYVFKVAVDVDDLRDGFPMQNKDLVEKYLDKHASYFQEISLQGKAKLLQQICCCGFQNIFWPFPT